MKSLRTTGLRYFLLMMLQVGNEFLGPTLNQGEGFFDLINCFGPEQQHCTLDTSKRNFTPIHFMMGMHSFC